MQICRVGKLFSLSFFLSFFFGPIHPIIPKQNLRTHVHYLNILKIYTYTVVICYVYYKPIKMETKIETSVYFSHTLVDYLVSTLLP